MPVSRRDIGWQEFGDLCKQLASEVASRVRHDAVVGIARGGSIVGATLSFMLNLEYFPIRLAKRGGVTRVIVPPTADLSGRSAVLVDDLSRTGETFKIAHHDGKTWHVYSNGHQVAVGGHKNPAATGNPSQPG